jgi:hypothetical protein
LIKFYEQTQKAVFPILYEQTQSSIMALLRLSKEEVEHIGLELAGFDVHRQARTCAATNRERFQGSYGVSPKTLSVIFLDLQTTEIAKARIDRPNIRNFLMTLNWFKAYKTESQLAGHFGIDEKTARKHIWEYARRIQQLKGQKVSFDQLG